MSHTVNIGPAFRNSFTLPFFRVLISMRCSVQELLNRFQSLTTASGPIFNYCNSVYDKGKIVKKLHHVFLLVATPKHEAVNLNLNLPCGSILPYHQITTLASFLMNSLLRLWEQRYTYRIHCSLFIKQKRSCFSLNCISLKQEEGIIQTKPNPNIL